MCDLLIYRGPNWMDDSNAYVLAHTWLENRPGLTPEQIMDSKERLIIKYEARYRKGDIVDIYPEGTITERPVPANKCVAIRITGLSHITVRNYLEPLVDEDGIIRRKRKFQILWDDLPQAMKDQLRDERFLIVTRAQAIPFIREHVI